jgi:hypothetical protein
MVGGTGNVVELKKAHGRIRVLPVTRLRRVAFALL